MRWDWTIKMSISLILTIVNKTNANCNRAQSSVTGTILPFLSMCFIIKKNSFVFAIGQLDDIFLELRSVYNTVSVSVTVTFYIVFMLPDRLMDRMGSRTILSIKQSVTISALIKFGRHGDGTCKQNFRMIWIGLWDSIVMLRPTWRTNW